MPIVGFVLMFVTLKVKLLLAVCPIESVTVMVIPAVPVLSGAGVILIVRLPAVPEIKIPPAGIKSAGDAAEDVWRFN